MTDKNREEFEAWHRETFSDRLQNGHPTRDKHNGMYAERYTVQCEQERWEAWQASRSALTVELPDPGTLASSDSPWCVMDACREAVESAGVKVKA